MSSAAELNEVLRNVEVKHENFARHDHGKEMEVLASFRSSKAFCRLIRFLVALCDASVGKTMPEAQQVCTDRCKGILNFLDHIDGVVDQVEPVKTATRFGNPAFKTLMGMLSEETSKEKLLDHMDFLSAEWRQKNGAATMAYALRGLGDGYRVDYGTGHELSFVCFLCSVLWLSQEAKEAKEGEGDDNDDDVLPPLPSHLDLQSCALVVFPRYCRLVRRLQQRYWLEPAGSRGCWGLDDYQMLPFVVGAFQLSHHPRLKPRHVLQSDMVESFAPDFLYMDCVLHVHRIKSAASSFQEHAPMLWDITGVPRWSDVSRGLLSMLNREVMGKYAVVQHFTYDPQLMPSQQATQHDVQSVEQLLPVTAADRRLGPVVNKEHGDPHHHHNHHGHDEKQKIEIPCCSDAIRFPSSASMK